VFLHVAGAPVPVFWTLAPIEAPLLVGWAGGPDAERLAGRPAEEVLRAALRSAARGLGTGADALEERLDAGTVVDWTRDRFAGGGYAVLPVGSSGASGARPQRRGTLFFARERPRTATPGRSRGAIASGEQAAREVLGTR
jgi:monoamine oxidase